MGAEQAGQAQVMPLLMTDEPQVCHVFDGTTGKLVQGALFLCCCAALFFKYHRNQAGRTFGEFLMDSSKQIFGAGWVHVLNVVCAEQIGRRFENEGGDECDWYW